MDANKSYSTRFKENDRSKSTKSTYTECGKTFQNYLKKKRKLNKKQKSKLKKYNPKKNLVPPKELLTDAVMSEFMAYEFERKKAEKQNVYVHVRKLKGFLSYSLNKRQLPAFRRRNDKSTVASSFPATEETWEGMNRSDEFVYQQPKKKNIASISEDSKLRHRKIDMNKKHEILKQAIIRVNLDRSCRTETLKN